MGNGPISKYGEDGTWWITGYLMETFRSAPYCSRRDVAAPDAGSFLYRVHQRAQQRSRHNRGTIRRPLAEEPFDHRRPQPKS